jgi:hypothetical protein
MIADCLRRFVNAASELFEVSPADFATFDFACDYVYRLHVSDAKASFVAQGIWRSVVGSDRSSKATPLSRLA